MKKYIAVLEIGDDKEIVGSIDATVSYTYRRNGMNHVRFERVEFKEKQEEIKVGDEVTDDDGWNGVVTWIDPDGEYLIILQKDGTALRWKKDIFKKTGRHFSQIEEVLEQMQEGNE